MPLDWQIRAFLELFERGEALAFHALGVEKARRAIAEQSIPLGPPQPVAAVEDRSIPGPDGEVTVRIYRPYDPVPAGALVYFHGGGWVLGSIATHDAVCRALTNAAGCVTVSVEYRLAPEHKFPAGLEDCFAATGWVVENAENLGLRAPKVAVGGDSAGGNLAACVALKARELGGPQIAAQLLIYPVIDDSLDTPSYEAFGQGYFLTRADMEWFWNLYVKDPSDRDNPLCCPSKAKSVDGLPPALIVTAEFDPLRDEAEQYAQRLKAAGVPVTLKRYDGMIHGFFRLGHLVERARCAVKEVGELLRLALT